MQKLVPNVGVPINFRNIINSIWLSFFTKRDQLLQVFKKGISNHVGFKYVRTFQSGYLSLYYLLLKIKGDKQHGEIITPVYTCPSVYFAIKNAELTPIFIDAEINTINSSLEYIVNKISNNTIAIVVLHIFGCYSIDINELRVLLSEIGREDIVIIEDMCQGLGNIMNSRSSEKQYGDYGILSFGRAKMVSTINGGAIVSNNSDILDIRVNENRNTLIQNIYICFKSILFGIIIKPYFFKIANLKLTKKRLTDPYNLNDYINIDHPNDSELSNYQLSLGIKMLERLSDFNLIRKFNAKFYLKYFSDKTKFIIQPTTNNFYLRFSVIFKNEFEREFVNEFLMKNGIVTSTVDYPLLSTINNFQASTFSSSFPNASFIASNILTFPTHPGVRMTDYTDLFDKLRQILKKDGVQS